MRLLNEINKFKKNHKKEKRNLPCLFFFTDRKQFKDIFAIIEKLPKNTAIIIREYDLSYLERLKFAQKVVKIARNRQLLTFAGKSLKLALEAKTNGIHFSDHETSWQKYLTYKKSNPNFLFSCACHNEKSINKASKLNMDFIFFSPIFKTNSHPNVKPVGLKRLKNISIKNQNIYALGGINENNIKLLRNSKILGLGIISLINKF